MTAPPRDPAEVLLTAEIQALERQIDVLLREEEEFRSRLIDRQVQRLKLTAVSARYQRALRTIQDAAD